MRDLEKRLARLESELTPTACNCATSYPRAFRYPHQTDEDFEASLTPDFRAVRDMVCPVHGETTRVRVIEFVSAEAVHGNA